MAEFLRRLTPDQLRKLVASPPVDAAVLDTANAICKEIREAPDGSAADAVLKKIAARLGDWDADSTAELMIRRDALAVFLQRLDSPTRQVLERTRDRITRFARAQLDSLHNMSIDVPGGRAGHTLVPVERVGCYAPAGRYPLPSTVMMTVAVARAAGCRQVILATPRPGDLMLATAALAGADAVLPIGGAQSIAALAYGTASVPAVDMIVGPGNQWVTAAKQIVSGRVGIDMLAGPSELAILADDSADPSVIAADLLAQAEHDTAARTFLVTCSEALAMQVNAQLESQLADLPTADTARAALNNGGYLVASDPEACIEAINQIGAEHLQIMTDDAAGVAERIEHAGCIFIGHGTAEVFGDYGIGPNHTLPTGNTARYRGGLSALDFCRVRTWVELEQIDPQAQDDMASLAQLEGLEAHSAAARIARTKRPPSQA